MRKRPRAVRAGPPHWLSSRFLPLLPQRKIRPNHRVRHPAFFANLIRVQRMKIPRSVLVSHGDRDGVLIILLQPADHVILLILIHILLCQIICQKIRNILKGEGRPWVSRPRSPRPDNTRRRQSAARAAANFPAYFSMIFPADFPAGCAILLCKSHPSSSPNPMFPASTRSPPRTASCSRFPLWSSPRLYAFH